MLKNEKKYRNSRLPKRRHSAPAILGSEQIAPPQLKKRYEQGVRHWRDSIAAAASAILKVHQEALKKNQAGSKQFHSELDTWDQRLNLQFFMADNPKDQLLIATHTTKAWRAVTQLEKLNLELIKNASAQLEIWRERKAQARSENRQERFSVLINLLKRDKSSTGASAPRNSLRCSTQSARKASPKRSPQNSTSLSLSMSRTTVTSIPRSSISQYSSTEYTPGKTQENAFFKHNRTLSRSAEGKRRRPNRPPPPPPKLKKLQKHPLTNSQATLFTGLTQRETKKAPSREDKVSYCFCQ